MADTPATADRPSVWRIEYGNDTGYEDDGFWEWWTVTDGARSFKCDTEAEAKWLAERLSAVSVAPAVPQDLHKRIMNLPCAPREGTPNAYQIGYLAGHRDARHAAAELALSASPSTPAAVPQEPMHMTLCEFGWLVPRPGQTYVAVHIPGCEACDKLAAAQQEAYGASSPTVNDDGSLGAPHAGLSLSHSTPQGNGEVERG